MRWFDVYCVKTAQINAFDIEEPDVSRKRGESKNIGFYAILFSILFPPPLRAERLRSSGPWSDYLQLLERGSLDWLPPAVAGLFMFSVKYTLICVILE